LDGSQLECAAGEQRNPQAKNFFISCRLIGIVDIIMSKTSLQFQANMKERERERDTEKTFVKVVVVERKL
jgi:hypothetical protein